MQFSTRTTYGLRALINLAKRKDGYNISLSDISQEENISLKYLEKLFASLKNAGLIKSIKGVNGGYRLAVKSNKINLFDIIKALEGKISPFHCLDDTGKVYCHNKCNCKATLVLKKLQQSIASTLKNLKLNQLL